MGFAVQSFAKGRFRVRFSFDEADREAALRLRARVFRGDADRDDRDAFDARCCHVLVEEDATGALVCCFRMLSLPEGRGIDASYAAQFYDLTHLKSYAGKMVELGRFCVMPGMMDPDILRSAWGALTTYVDAEGVDLLFGCSSFAGTCDVPHRDTFALLAERHLAPACWAPAAKAPKVFRFLDELSDQIVDPKRSTAQMPPLLRTYLMMGGWVSDHAVIDEDLGTMHVFTGVEIAAIPPARKRLLRAVAR